MPDEILIVNEEKHPNLWKLTAGVVPTVDDSTQHRAAALYAQLAGQFGGDDEIIMASRWGVRLGDGKKYNYVAVNANLYRTLNDAERILFTDVLTVASRPNISAGLIAGVVMWPADPETFDHKTFDPNTSDDL